MLDLYIVITPIFGFLSLLTIINLKFTLTEPKQKDLKKYQKKLPSDNNIQIEHIIKTPVKDQSMQPGYKKTLLYLLKNFTLADFCFVRRSRNKIPLLLSLPIIAILQLICNIPQVFCAIGTVISLLFVGGKALTAKEEEESSDELAAIKQKVKKREEEKFQQKSELILTSLTLLLNLIFIGLTFKNYRNVLLESATYNFLIAIALDNLILKPIVFILVAYPVKNVQFVDEFINKEIQIVEILHQERVPMKVFDTHISALSPKKLYNSPSKVPKAVHVEPRINLENKENYLSTIELTKALRKPKLSPINSKKTLQHHVDDCSLISILNSNEKKKNQAFEKNSSFDFDKSLFEEKVQPEDEPIPEVQMESKQKEEEQSESKYSVDTGKRNKMKSSKLILINQDNSIINNFENEVENEEDEDANQNKSGLKQKSLRDSDYKASSRNCDGLKISLHKSIEDENENKQNFDAFFEEEANPYLGRPHSTLEEDNSILGYGTITHTSRRDGLLQIHEDRRGEDLEEIDLNSPERRKQQLSKIVEDAHVEKVQKKKKNHKKYSLDPNRHVIKHSTGEPYLEFLPNLLNKEREQKVTKFNYLQKKKSNQQGSQQMFSNKMDVVHAYNDSRLSKSVKRPKNSNTVILKQNDENRVPEFMIEDFN